MRQEKFCLLGVELRQLLYKVEGVLYIFGGYGGRTDHLDNFYSFSFEENEWRKVEVLSDERPGCQENND